MKIKEGFVLSEINGETVAVPIGELSVQFHNIVRLNKTAADIWHWIDEGKDVHEISACIVEKYNGVNIEQAEHYVNEMINRLRENNILE